MSNILTESTLAFTGPWPLSLFCPLCYIVTLLLRHCSQKMNNLKLNSQISLKKREKLPKHIGNNIFKHRSANTSLPIRKRPNVSHLSKTLKRKFDDPRE